MNKAAWVSAKYVTFFKDIAGFEAGMEKKTTPIRKIFEMMTRTFRPERVGNERVIIQYDISGPDGGKWYIKIDKGRCEAEEGEDKDANLTIFADASDFKDIRLGRLDTIKAYMTRKLRVKGDMKLAMEMDNWFEQPVI